MTDLHNVPIIPAPRRQPEQPQTVSDRTSQALYTAPRVVASSRYWGGSQAVRAHVEPYVPDQLSPEERQLSEREMAIYMQMVDKLVTSTPAAEAGPTSLALAEQDFLDNSPTYGHDGKPSAQIHGELSGIRSESEQVGSE